MKVSPLLWIALPVSCVDEVIQLQTQNISPIPAVNSCLLGITNQRGKMLWVLHLERFLGIKPVPLSKQISAIAIRSQIPNGGICRIACVVMALEEIITLDSEKFFPVPDKLPPRVRSLLSGLVNVEKKTYGILNVNAVFRLLNPEMVGNQETPDEVFRHRQGA